LPQPLTYFAAFLFVLRPPPLPKMASRGGVTQTGAAPSRGRLDTARHTRQVITIQEATGGEPLGSYLSCPFLPTPCAPEVKFNIEKEKQDKHRNRDSTRQTHYYYRGNPLFGQLVDTKSAVFPPLCFSFGFGIFPTNLIEI
jgi:hypothetical protein